MSAHVDAEAGLTALDHPANYGPVDGLGQRMPWMLWVVVGKEELIIEDDRDVRAIHRCREAEVISAALVNQWTPVLHTNELRTIRMPPVESRPDSSASTATLTDEATSFVDHLHKG